VDGGESNSARRERGDAPPQQRYKLTDEIKNLIWQLVTINNELAAMTNTMQCVVYVVRVRGAIDPLIKAMQRVGT
jgi:hypothetical protein